MNPKIKQHWNNLLFISYGLGNLLLALTRIFGNSLTNFELGILEGLSIVFIICGTSHLIICAIRKQKPFSITQRK